MEKQSVLILWSGGIDSTATLKMYLESTDYNVIAHHIFYKCNNDARQEKELESINNILPKLKLIRDFEYVESAHVFEKYPRIYDVTMMFILSLPIAIHYNCDKIILGFVSDIRHNQMDYILKNKKHLDNIATEFCEVNDFKLRPKLHISEFYLSKSEYILSLGSLLNDVWYCRGVVNEEKETIVTDTPCGQCHTCKHVEKSLKIIKKSNHESIC